MIVGPIRDDNGQCPATRAPARRSETQGERRRPAVAYDRLAATRCRLDAQDNHTTAHTHFALASLLTLVLVALTAVPAAAGGGALARQGAEDVAIRLTNCIRSGGHVTKAGKCRGWGKGNYSKTQPTLKRSTRISNRVSWPWARKSVQFYGRRTCWIGHAKNGSTVDKRFASVSLNNIANGENMGCGMYGTGKQTVITDRAHVAGGEVVGWSALEADQGS